MSKNSKKEISSGMFIPLHYSNLYKVVPEGENIIYSLYYKANLFEWGPFSTRKIWHTHLLITTNGLYFGWYQKRKPPNVKFVNWLAVKKFSRSKIKIKRAIYHLKPKRERNFETRRDFRNRKKDVSNHVKE
ncbi:MAG: hypothetical protein EAX91_17940, partial [Candidatus Lokiarchaeota archaeon]|nr:hypothetical protein [Candidatus Lokiarchaeota archaeon]